MPYLVRERSAAGGPLPYGGSQPEWPYGADSTAVVFAQEEAPDGLCWGFFDPEWRDEATGVGRGKLRINVASPSGRGGTGGGHQTQTWWADANSPVEIIDRIMAAVQFAYEEGRRAALADG